MPTNNSTQPMTSQGLANEIESLTMLRAIVERFESVEERLEDLEHSDKRGDIYHDTVRRDITYLHERLDRFERRLPTVD